MATAPTKCGKCGKTVYATEEIKCLDKVSSSIHLLYMKFSFLVENIEVFLDYLRCGIKDVLNAHHVE
jgi:hypothetical protein